MIEILITEVDGTAHRAENGMNCRTIRIVGVKDEIQARKMAEMVFWPWLSLAYQATHREEFWEITLHDNKPPMIPRKDD